MDRPAPVWPLLTDGEFDVFRDRVPWGVTMRGEQVEQAMLGRHGLVAAVSKQGKTACLRIPALTLALDPTVELRIADLKGDGDWSMFAPRAHTLIEGGAEEQADATCAMLEDLVENMQDRYERKRALGVRGNISRDLSRTPGSGFHPIFAFIDECQVLYQAQHPIGGTKADARAWRAAKRLHDQARAVNIHLYQATQRPDPTAIPGPVREGAHVRIGLYVPNYEAAKMALADAADMGARPQDLRPGRDRGTFVATGEFDGIGEGMAFLIVKSHFVDTPDAYPVIDRAMNIHAHHGHALEQATVATEPAAVVDHLTNIADVLGREPRLRTQVVLHRLAELDPATYTDWTFTDLADALPEGAKPYKTKGYMQIATALVHESITERDSGEREISDPGSAID
jgi:S-DNA-T family DNA segregation ATPase FtsK/SpoIIIE